MRGGRCDSAAAAVAALAVVAAAGCAATPARLAGPPPAPLTAPGLIAAESPPPGVRDVRPVGSLPRPHPDAAPAAVSGVRLAGVDADRAGGEVVRAVAHVVEPPDERPAALAPPPLPLSEDEAVPDEFETDAEEADADDPESDDTNPRGDAEIGDDREPPEGASTPLPPLPGDAPGVVREEDVIASVYQTFPLLQASLTQRREADGRRLAASGAFDRLLEAESINQPLSFYENYRHKVRLSRNLYDGGNVFAQYALGRGEFEPWYQERLKQEGGEFAVGILRPLRQGDDIDQRRAALWRATLQRQEADPAVRVDLIDYVFEGLVAYAQWRAAGRRLTLAESLLEIAEVRGRQVQRRVELGDLDPPVLPENERLILTRRSAVLAAERDLTRAAQTLSLYYRDQYGNPLTPPPGSMPASGGAADLSVPSPETDLPAATAARPELAVLDLQAAQTHVTLAEARNRLLPQLDVAGKLAQDVGGKASSADDKGELELEAAVFFEVPLERRRAQGDIVQAEAKLAAITARRRIANDRVLVELRRAAAAIAAAAAQRDVAARSIDLAQQLVRAERRRFELGESSLLEVTLREQQLAESTGELIGVDLDLAAARAAYRAALGVDRLPEAAMCP